MNWIEKLFGKEEHDILEIRFDELPGWLESVRKKFSEKLERHTTFVYSDIENALHEIRKSTASLEEAKPEGRFHLKMVKIATSNRDNMVKQVRLLMNNITVPKTTDIKTMMEFHESAMRTLNACLENMMKSYQYTKMVLFEESKDVIADVNELGRLLNQLVEPINDNKKTLETFENAGSAMQNLRNMYSQVEPLKKTIKGNEEEIDRIKKKIEVDQDYLTRLADSDQWKRYLNNKNDSVDLDNKAKKTISEINILMLPLNKALIRIKQLNEDGKYNLTPDVKKGLHLCLSDPKSVSREFFVELQNIIQSDTAAFTPEKRDKILKEIKYVAGNIEALKMEYQNIVSKIEVKRNEISKMNIVQEAANLEGRISDLQDKLASAGKELDMAKKHLASLDQGIELRKQELQQLVSAIDSRVRVLF